MVLWKKPKFLLATTDTSPLKFIPYISFLLGYWSLGKKKISLELLLLRAITTFLMDFGFLEQQDWSKPRQEEEIGLWSKDVSQPAKYN